jgi:hypothetical protein
MVTLTETAKSVLLNSTLKYCNVKKLLFLMATVVCINFVTAQKISNITLTGYGSREVISFLTSDRVYLQLSKDGRINEWGIDFGIGRPGYWPGRLDKYMGRVEYYSSNEDQAFRGKVRYIGLTLITYYGSNEEASSVGKIKSIGNINFDYYGNYEDAAIKGLIKNIGGTTFSYYASYDNEATKGKFRSVGSTQFSWYTSFDDKAFKGKIKSIDNNNFTYYSSFERTNGLQGVMKSGFQNRYINGIDYYVRN